MAPLLAFGLTSAAGCASRDCKENALFGLRVSIVDAEGRPVCDATVTARDHDFMEVLRAFPADTPCRYAGAVERKGTYSITAAQGAAAATVSDVKVTADRCHVRPADVSLQLNR